VLTVRCTFGQETRATIGGKVTDQQGAVIQQAAVTVVAEATQVVQKTITNDAGDWRIRDLLPGRYDLQITVPGFKPAKYDGIDLQVDDEKILDTRMQVGAQTVSVTVEGGTPLIDTSAAVSGTVVTDTEMLEVPSQSDAPTSLVALTPGVTANVGVNGGLYLWEIPDSLTSPSTAPDMQMAEATMESTTPSMAEPIPITSVKSHLSLRWMRSVSSVW
jgi:outer membrane receptor protein involved in Fe transport